MGKRKWTSERKWEGTAREQNFERLLKENGYTIKAYKEYISYTAFLIYKDGIEMEWTFSSDVQTAKGWFRIFEDAFKMKVNLEKLRLEVM